MFSYAHKRNYLSQSAWSMGVKFKNYVGTYLT